MVAEGFAIRIFLLGLVALIPDGGNLKIVVPTTEKQDHFSVLSFPCASPCSLAGNTPQLAKSLGVSKNLDRDHLLRASYDPGCIGYALMGLNGVTLSIDNLTPGCLTFVHGQRRRRVGDLVGALPLTAREGEDFSWVPSMSSIRGSVCHLGKEYSDPKYGHVAAVLSIQGADGKVSTASLVSVLEDPLTGCFGLSHPLPFPDGPVAFIRSLSFSRAGSIARSPRQAFADGVVVELRTTSPQANLKFTPSSGGPIVLSPVGRGPVDIAIANLVERQEVAYSCEKPAPSHFDLYHEMAAESENRPKLPHLGLDMRRTRLEEIYKYPPVVKVLYEVRVPVSKGGLNRPICMLATYSK
jgi:hypothetical protein